ncbi:VTT domain-containing protein [Microbacterium aurantiacum]|uniref:VTT domain-containing protein n=2 Tax=Microbacterium aurantiacum TaxID=162393 RepID=A0ABT8FR75_9MICO|nr:VTT domain-containing protein [Microbacterium aurantiacum]
MLPIVGASAWALPLMALLVFTDALLVVVPGEVVVTAFGAVSAGTGSPGLVSIILVAAAAATAGDAVCFLIGRRVGTDRWRWMRARRVGAALAWARTRLDRSTAVVLFAARFVPFARLAVNITAGATGVPAAKHLALAATAATAWAAYQAVVGAVVARLVPGGPTTAVAVSIAVALTLGILIDVALSRAGGRSSRP